MCKWVLGFTLSPLYVLRYTGVWASYFWSLGCGGIVEIQGFIRYLNLDQQTYSESSRFEWNEGTNMPAKCSLINDTVHCYVFRFQWNYHQAINSVRGTRWRSWLRHCATSQKVAGLIFDCVIGIFHWHNPSGRSMALGLTQPLTEISTRNVSWG